MIKKIFSIHLIILLFALYSKSIAQYGLGPNEHILQAGAGVGRMEGDMFDDEVLPHLNLSYEYIFNESFSMGGFTSYGVGTANKEVFFNSYYNFPSYSTVKFEYLHSVDVAHFTFIQMN